ncbi:TnpV protein [Oscillospiraceae bacterium 21-37]
MAELTYRQEGSFLLPELETEKPVNLGKYGLLRLAYLVEHRPIFYNRLILEGTLGQHLTEIDQTANQRLELLLPQIQKSMGITESLKARDPMKWVGLMSNAKHQAEETILTELVYS